MTDAANRILWTIIGVLLLAVGVVAVLATTGTWPSLPNGATLATPVADDQWTRAPSWTIAVAVATGVILVILGLLLLIRQLSTRRAPAIDNVILDGDNGRTHVDSSSVVTAWQRDVASTRTIARARARVSGDPSRHDAWLRIDLSPSGTIEDARKHIAETLDRLETTAGWRPAHLDVTVRAARDDQRVR